MLTRSTRRPARRGAILMVVLAMLALFAVLGLSFVLYAESQATAARIHREAMNKNGDSGDSPPPDPAAAANGFMRMLLYPVADTGDETLSALRGYEMARMVYGYRSGDTNAVAYNGHGLFHEMVDIPGVSGGLPRSSIINYSWQFDRLTAANSRIVDPEHSSATSRTSVGAALSPTYVGKNAPYTYADRNNAYVAVMDPVTGRIVVPSFHRPSLFGSLDQSNPNWQLTSPQGRYMLLRPRPEDHKLNASDTTQFPYPTPNADGSITGDVQNWKWTNGVQQNDSVWLYPHLPTFQWRGKTVTPMIAPLILPLDGRINLMAAGSLAGTSNQGFGPWEMDLSGILGSTANAQATITARQGATMPPPRSTAFLNRPFHPNPSAPFNASLQIQPSSGSAVDFDANATTGLTLPTGFATTPTWGTGFDNSNYVPGTPDTGEVVNHPSLWNPFERERPPGATAAPLAFPLTDLKQMAGCYSDKPLKYGQTWMGRQPALDPIFGQAAGSGPSNPANLRRALTTVISNSLKRPGLAPNFLADSTAFQYAGGTPPPSLATLPTFNVGSVTGGSASDVLTTTTAVRNLRAALGAVDVNRPLADYRDASTRPGMATSPWVLSPTTVTATSFAQAWTDRQQLAQDIFARLVVVTGAQANVDGSTGVVTVTATAGTAQYDALRWLAQLSANIVDYVDGDDVNTPFVWNPTGTGWSDTAANFADQTTINARVVFGVEKPRLVINEAYAELACDPTDRTANRAMNQYRARFFIELLNPGQTDTNPQTPLGYVDGGTTLVSGAAPLRYTAQNIPVYRVQVFTNATTVRTDLAASANSTGAVTALIPRLEIDTLDLGANVLADRVEPNGGVFAAAGTNRNGFAVIGPTVNVADDDSTGFYPDTSMAPYDLMLQKPFVAATATNALEYQVDQTSATTDGNLATLLTNLNANKHAVVLQRLACPYLAYNAQTNPYITVDTMTNVQVQDAVRVLYDAAIAAPRTTPANRGANWAIGRVQPFAGYQSQVAADDPAAATAPTWTQTLVLRQTRPSTATVQQETLFQHNTEANTDASASASNATGTLLYPFEWMTHLDRRLVNQLELLHVSAVRPHELTQRFAMVNRETGADRAWFHRHDLQAPQVGTGANTLPAGPLFAANSPLYRMFEVLTVKPWTVGQPEGGRVAGRVNVNMMWDRRILDAVLNPQAANGFVAADTQTIWDNLFANTNPALLGTGTRTGHRTKNFPQVTETYDENPSNTDADRPFKSLGAALIGASSPSLPGGAGIEDTLLRTGSTTAVQPPLFYLPTTATRTHPYQQAEALRKAYNNLTTVSDTYLVVFTVGFFEVRNAGPYSATNPPVLGAEVYQATPGDARSQYVAVIDRTQLGVDGSGNQVSSSWFSELTANTAVGATQVTFPAAPTGSPSEARVYSNGTAYKVTATPDPIKFEETNQLRIGTGEATSNPATNVGDGEWVTVSALAYDATTGLATATLSAATTRYHPAGTTVSNAFLRNPGPLPNPSDFDPSPNRPDRRYNGVVPYFAKINP